MPEFKEIFNKEFEISIPIETLVLTVKLKPYRWKQENNAKYLEMSRSIIRKEDGSPALNANAYLISIMVTDWDYLVNGKKVSRDMETVMEMIPVKILGIIGEAIWNLYHNGLDEDTKN